MERYYRNKQNATPMLTDPPADNDSVLSEFDRHRQTLVLGQEGDGWQGELCRYLKDMPANVTKETDIVEWWQVCSSLNVFGITHV